MGGAKSKNEAEVPKGSRRPERMTPYSPQAPLNLQIEDLKLHSITVQATQGTLVSDLYKSVQAQLSTDQGIYIYDSGRLLDIEEPKTLGECGIRSDCMLDLVYQSQPA